MPSYEQVTTLHPWILLKASLVMGLILWAIVLLWWELACGTLWWRIRHAPIWLRLGRAGGRRN